MLSQIADKLRNIHVCIYHHNHIGGVMLSVLFSGAVGRGFDFGRLKPKTIKLALLFLC